MKGLKRGLLMVATVAGVAMLTSVQVNAAEINKNKENYERLLRPLFDGEWYATNYPDVVKVYGTNEDALFDHFMTYGITEGRDINAVFDVEKYKEANPDLAEQFGDDYAAYYEHYVTYGQVEQRPLQVESNNFSDNNYLISSLQSDTHTETDFDEYMEYKWYAHEKGIDTFMDKCKKNDEKFYTRCNEVREKLKTKPNIDYSNEIATTEKAFDVEAFDQEKFNNDLMDYKNKIQCFDNSYDEYKTYAENHLYDINEIKKLIVAAEQDGTNIEKARKAKQTTESAYNSIIKKRDLINDAQRKMYSADNNGKMVDKQMTQHRGIVSYALTPLIDKEGLISEVGNYRAFGDTELDALLFLYKESSFWNYSNLSKYAGAIDRKSEDYKIIEEMKQKEEGWGWQWSKIDSFMYDENPAEFKLALIRSQYTSYKEYGAIIEKYSDEAKADRLAFESLTKTKALIKLLNDLNVQIDESREMEKKREEERQNIISEIEHYSDEIFDEYYGKDISKEDENFVLTHNADLLAKSKEFKKLNSEIAYELDMITFLKSEADSLVCPEGGDNDDPEDPETPGEVVNPEDPGTPGEVVNPEDPGTSGEVVNPEDPGTTGEVVNPENPGKPSVTISVNGNITITVVDDHTISVDFGGHIEVQCAG